MDYIIEKDKSFGKEINSIIDCAVDLGNDNHNLLREIYEQYKEKLYIAGGVFKDIYQKSPHKDVDIYFYDEETFKEVVETIEKVSKTNAKKKYANENAVCYSFGPITVDFICKNFADPLTIIKRFDFIVTKAALYTTDGVDYVVRHKNTVQQIQSKILEYDENYVITPGSSPLERLIRYSRYGYTPTHETIVKTVKSIQKEDLANFGTEELFDKIYAITEALYDHAENNKADNLFFLLEGGKKPTRDESVLAVFEEALNNHNVQAYKNTGMIETLVFRQLRQYAYGFNETAEKCEKILETWGKTDSSLKTNHIQPSITMLNFLEYLKNNFADNEIIAILRFLTAPTGFAPTVPGTEVFITCCPHRNTQRLELEHTNQHYQHRTQENNRDNEAELIKTLLEKYGLEETLYYLETIFDNTTIAVPPSYYQWINNINNGLFTIDLDFSFFVDLMETETEHN